MKRRMAVAAALMAVGVAGIVLGIWRGELRIIFMKAVNICLECIGIG